MQNQSGTISGLEAAVKRAEAALAARATDVQREAEAATTARDRAAAAERQRDDAVAAARKSQRTEVCLPRPSDLTWCYVLCYSARAHMCPAADIEHDSDRECSRKEAEV